MNPPRPAETESAPWTPRRVAAGTLVICAILAATAALYALRNVLLLLIVAVVVETAIHPLIDRIARWIPRSAAVAACYMSLGVALLLTVAYGIPPLLEQSSGMIDSLPKLYGTLRGELSSVPISLIQRLAGLLPETLPEVPWHEFSTDATTGASLIGTLADAALRGAISVAAVIILAFYLSLQGARTIAAALLWIEDERRESLRQFLTASRIKVGAFVRGQSVLCLFVAALSLIGFWTIGLPYALPLAAVAGILEMVPYFGPTLGFLPAAGVAAATNPGLLLGVLIVAVLTQVIENNLLVPRVMQKAVGVHPVVTLLAILGFGTLMGSVGVILAIPMAAVIQLVFERLLLSGESGEVATPEGRSRASRLRLDAGELIRDVRSRLREKPESPGNEADRFEDELEAIAAELDKNLAQFEGDESVAAAPLPQTA